MKFIQCRVFLLSILCIILAPFAVAEEILIAKVYRDYPGYIEAPTCAKPRSAPVADKKAAVRNDSTEVVAAEGASAKLRARKVYRDYPGYLAAPTCINPRMAPSYVKQHETNDSKSAKLAAANLAAAKLAAEKLAAEKLAAENLAAEKLAAEKLAAEKLAAEKLAAEKLAAEKLAAEKLAAEKVAAEKVAAEKLAAEKLVVKQNQETSKNLPTQFKTSDASVDSSDKASFLRNVSVTPGQVVFESDGSIEQFKYFTLTDPPRLVVDIFELKPVFEERSFPAEAGFKDVRIGAHDDKTRLVFDSSGTKLPKFTVEKNSTDIVVSWVGLNADHAVEKEIEASAVTVAELQMEEDKGLEPAFVGEEQHVAKKLAAEKLAAEKLAAEKLAAEKLAAEKLAAEKLAAEKLAAEKLGAEKLAAEKLAAEKLAAEKLAAEKLAAEKLAAEKLAAEKLAAEKLAAEKLATEKVAAEKLAAEKLATEKVAAEKLAAEKLAAEKLAAEKLAAEKLAAEKLVVANSEPDGKQELRLSPHFPSFVATLQETDLARLEQLVDQLKSQKLASVEVIGHCDNLPIVERSRHIFADNLALSRARARNVAEYLQQQLGVPSEIIILRGLGDSMPMADNSTETGRALNRRVEIALVTEPVKTPDQQERAKLASAAQHEESTALNAAVRDYVASH